MNSKKEKKKKNERQNTLQTKGKGLSQHAPGHRFEFFH